MKIELSDAEQFMCIEGLHTKAEAAQRAADGLPDAVPEGSAFALARGELVASSIRYYALAARIATEGAPSAIDDAPKERAALAAAADAETLLDAEKVQLTNAIDARIKKLEDAVEDARDENYSMLDRLQDMENERDEAISTLETAENERDEAVGYQERFLLALEMLGMSEHEFEWSKRSSDTLMQMPELAGMDRP